MGTDGSLAGVTLRLRHAETWTVDGDIIPNDQLGGVQGRTTFILSEEASQTFDTLFAYFGFRFVELRGWPRLVMAFSEMWRSPCALPDIQFAGAVVPTTNGNIREEGGDCNAMIAAPAPVFTTVPRPFPL